MLRALILSVLVIQTTWGQIQLPERAKEAIDIALTSRWHHSEQYLYKCNLNGDSLPDYAMKVTVGDGKCLVEYNLALIADSDGFAFHLLGADPAHLDLSEREDFVLRLKGETVTDFNASGEENGAPREMILETDALEFIPKDGCCATTFIYRNGRFRIFTSSD